uniref:Uncharacterized protein n=1 Tax=Chromera velia CCMP2878 TaxID=1169474 RepID=A0A0G4GTC9_9ALVE|eukprot:Cvel_23307.t1-p1 / transcript=Cvel_23307.t1 / gene=Cvel_23307 / organism=Chromera_velia_CCMP2878 / gene_product=hypothetical protein / transcript_product=hypothetical protein / location=Cvel_scaffold2387:6262-6954(-) / protein_length=165 / sequence_SO=supercontig / SO=protein_coding / is_pseudo=false
MRSVFFTRKFGFSSPYIPALVTTLQYLPSLTEKMSQEVALRLLRTIARGVEIDDYAVVFQRVKPVRMDEDVWASDAFDLTEDQMLENIRKAAQESGEKTFQRCTAAQVFLLVEVVEAEIPLAAATEWHPCQKIPMFTPKALESTLCKACQAINVRPIRRPDGSLD